MKEINGLKAKSELNDITLNYKVKTSGRHEIVFAADKPISHIVEGYKNDNTVTGILDIKNIRYPDLSVFDVAINPENAVLEPGQPLIITASVFNDIYSHLDKEVKVSFYSGDSYIGTTIGQMNLN